MAEPRESVGDDELPLVSVVTPSLNTGAFIEQTIRSVVEQDYPRKEHIVLDSGSTDATPEILARYPSLRVVSPAPASMPEKVNRGFELARGEIVSWINADDYFLPGAFHKAVAALTAHPDAGMVFCNRLEVDGQGREILREKSKQCGFHELVNERNWVPHQTAFFRKSVLDRVGGLDTSLRYVLDWDLWIRISREGPILYVDDYWAAFRVHTGQRSDVGRWDIWPETRRVSRRYGGAFFSPLFFDFYRAKATSAGRMLRRAELRTFARKLRGNLLRR